MIIFNRHIRIRYSKMMTLSSIVFIALVGLAQIARPAASAPITGTATSNLTVYGGVVTVAPAASGDNILELGNAGRDIAGTGDIFIRPGSLSGASVNFAKFYAVAGKAYLTVPGSVTANGFVATAQDTTSEGGEINLLRSSGSFHDWRIELVQDRLRFYSNGGEKFTVTQAGYAGVGAGTPGWVPSWPLEANSGTGVTTVNAQITATGSSGSGSRSAGYNIRIDGTNVWQMLTDNANSSGGHRQNSLYFQFNGSPTNRYLAIAPTGNVYAKNSLCFGDPNTSTNCRNTWAGMGGPASSLDAVLAVGNTSTRNAGLGSTTAPAGTLLVHNAQSGTIVDQPVLSPVTAFAGDGLAAFANSTNAAIFARQDSSGSSSYAGYFSSQYASGTAGALVARAGRAFNSPPGDPGNAEGIGFVAQHQFYNTSGSQQDLSWSRAAVFKGDLRVYGRNAPEEPIDSPGNYIGNVLSINGDIVSSSDGNLTGFPLHVNNLNPNGYAAWFEGAGQIVGAPANCSGACLFPRATLDVRNTFTSGSNISSTGIMVTGGTGGVGLYASGGSEAVRASGASLYAGKFVGTSLFEGSSGNAINVTIKRSAQAFEQKPITWVQLERAQATSCETACGASAGGGKCVMAWRHVTGGGSIDGTAPPAGGSCAAGYCSGSINTYCIPGVLNCGAGQGSCVAVAPSCGVGCSFSSSRLITPTAPAPSNNPWYEVLRCLCK